LPTGDRITVTPDGYYPAAGSKPTGPMIRYTSADGHRHLVPGGLGRYLGAGLDPALFDVDALSATEADGRLPVALTFDQGARPTAPAGVTLTAVTGNTATGYLTSGPAFADALRMGGPARAAAGLRTIGLPGSQPAKVAQPRYPLHTLEIDAVDTNGAPADALAVVFNTDDLGKQDMTFVNVFDGVARVAVPAGHYTVMGDIDDFGADGRPVNMHVMAVDTTVTDAPVSKVTLDEGTATSKISVTTPKPATQLTLTMYMDIRDANGRKDLFGFGVFGDETFPVYVAPRGKPAAGSLRNFTVWNGAPDDPAQLYHYALAFTDDNGIDANQHHVVKPQNLATVHARFTSDPLATEEQPGMVLLSAVDDATLADEGHDGVGYPLPPASVSTEYLGTEDGGRYLLTGYTGVGMFGNELVTYQGGHEYTVDFGHGAIAPAAGIHTGAQHCIACAAGDTLAFGVWPQGDSQHSGDLSNPVDSSRFTLARNGTTLADETGGYSAVVSSVPAGPAVYHATYDLDLSGVDGVSLSTATHTDLTVPFDPAKAAKLPANDSCDGGSATTPCRIVPLPTLRYDLLGLDLRNTTTSPVQVLHLEAAHLSYEGVGSKARFTSVKVSVSFDGGTTWRTVPVAGAAGHYVATWPNSAPAGTKPAIKVTATDADGAAITQSIANAYLIGARS
jgi:hypothetical protein